MSLRTAVEQFLQNIDDAISVPTSATHSEAQGFDAACRLAKAQIANILADNPEELDQVQVEASALRRAATAMREERQGWCLDDSGRHWIKRTLDELEERADRLEGK